MFNVSNETIHEVVVNQKSIEDTWKYLEKRDKARYSNRQEVTGAEGKDLYSDSEKYLKDIAENLKKTSNE